MNIPPPPTFHPVYSPYSSSYSLHTPETEASFDRFSTTNGSDRYTDTPLYRTKSQVPRIVDRRPSFHKAQTFSGYPSVGEDIQPPSAMASTAGKDFLYFAYEKGGAKWDEPPIIDEIPAPQSQIKKKAETKNKQYSAILNLEKMGASRREQIYKHVEFLNSCETDGSMWEPVYIKNTNTKQKGTVMEVKAFEIIFAKKPPKPKRQSTGLAPNAPHSPIIIEEIKPPKEEKPKKEKKKSKEKKSEPVPDRGALIDDPFAATDWFDMRTGAALGGQGMGVSGGPGLPPFIPPEKPIGSNMQPRIIPGLDPERDAQQVPLAEDPTIPPPPPIGLGVPLSAKDVLDNVPTMDDEHRRTHRRGSFYRRNSNRDSRDRGRRYESQSRSRSRSRPRRGSIRAASDSRTRNVHWPDYFGSPHHYHASSNSSVTSGEFAVIFDEVEELSSRTSEDTAGSGPGQKIYRVISPAYRQHRPGPLQRLSGSRQYELATEEKVVMPARTRRRSSRAIEQPQPIETYGFEQPLVRTNTASRQKAIVNQPIQPPTPQEQLPIAVYPSYFEEKDRQQRERDTEAHVNDYMRNAVRERSLRDREEDLDKRERVLRETQAQARLEKEQRARETIEMRDVLENERLKREFGRSRGAYNFEPREQFARR